MIDIEKIKSTVYALLHKDFHITIEDGTEIIFNFQMYNFYHLFGFHYLTDLPHISSTKHIDKTVKRFINGDIPLSALKKSVFWSKIEKRIEMFPLVETMLLGEKCEIIVDFDASIVESTWVKSEYFLYKTDDYITYNLFGLAQSKNHGYYPETFFVEPSKYYLTDQKLLCCKIEHTIHQLKKEK